MNAYDLELDLKLRYIDGLAKQVETGTNIVRVQCEIIIDRGAGKKTIRRCDTGESWDESLSPEEAQATLIPGGAPQTAPPAAKAGPKLVCSCPIVGYDVEVGAAWQCPRHGPMMRDKRGDNIERPPEENNNGDAKEGEG